LLSPESSKIKNEGKTPCSCGRKKKPITPDKCGGGPIKMDRVEDQANIKRKKKADTLLL
jgi:hypothetical protein